MKRKISKLRDSRGFTLVEFLLYMALLSIFLLTLTDLFTAILNVRLESEATSTVEQDGRFILARLAYDIPQASSITTPLSLGSTASTLQMTISATTYTYALSGSDLNLTIGASTNKLNGSETSISGLSFKKLGNAGGKETISIQFTLSSKTQRPSGPEIRTFTTTIGRR